MFSKNDKISKRQMFRLLAYDLLGIGTLLLPSALAGISGRNGMAAICIGMAVGLLYCIVIGWLSGLMEEGESYPAFLKRSFGTIPGMAVILIYGAYYLCIGGYTAYVFGHLIVTELLKGQSFYWVVAGILLLAIYAISQGIEGRARVYEILFWFLMAPLFLMLFLAAGDVEVPRLFPIFQGDGKGLFFGAYVSFEVFSLGGISFFLMPFARKKQSVMGALAASVLFCGTVLLLLYGILQGIFGTASMKSLEYPAVTLMSMIQIPGGFLQRQDALMLAIWFFTVFALLSSSMFYAVENLKELYRCKKDCIWMLFAAAAVFGISVASYRSFWFTTELHRIFLLAATPFAVGAPVAAALCRKLSKKGKKAISGAFLFGIVLFLSGCSTMELENRKFPLAMGVDKTEEKCRISYKFQDLSKVANENADGSSKTDFYVEDKDFFTGISKYANETDKILDYNHMKALILSKTFVEDDKALRDFMEICSRENLISRNTLLFFAEDAAEMLSLDQNLDSAIGSYLEEMVETREDYKLKDAVTFGDLYNDMENKEQLLLVPVLKEEGGLPAIRSYYAVLGGFPKGEVRVNEAILSYLCQGKLKKLSFSLSDGTAVKVERIRVRSGFARGREMAYCNTVRLEVAVETEGREEGAIKREIETWIEDQLKQNAKKLQNTYQIDIANSYCRLGMYDRDRYLQYQDDLEGYIRDLKHGFAVETVIINEQRKII